MKGNYSRAQQQLDPWALCQRMASEQHGLLTRPQLLATGLSEDQLAYLIRKKELNPRFRGIYALTAAPPGWKQDVLAAVFWGGKGAAASHRTAARLWRLDGFDRDVVEVSRPRGRTRCPDDRVVLHTSSSIHKASVVQIEGIPTTDIERTLVDLASVVDSVHLEGAMDCALRNRLTSANQLLWRLNGSVGPTKSGLGSLRKLAEARTKDAASQSNSEIKAARLLTRARLPAPVKQFPVQDSEGTMYIDLAYPKVMLAIEIDSWKWHSSRQDWERDRRKDQRLRELGWNALRFAWGDIEEHPQRFVETVYRELRVRGVI